MKHWLAIVAVSLAACGSKPPAPDWQVEARVAPAR
jgi:predicted small lipoprotein YifL